MISDQIRYEALSSSAQDAFEREFPIPNDATKPITTRLAGSPFSAIEIQFTLETWLVVFGIQGWLAGRLNAFTDGILKKLGEGLGEVAASSIKELVAHYRSSSEKADDQIKKLQAGRDAAQVAMNSPVRLIGALITDVDKEYLVRLDLENNMDCQEHLMAFLVMLQSIQTSAENIFVNRPVLFSTINVVICPSGYRLLWTEKPWDKKYQTFMPDGKCFCEPQDGSPLENP